MALSNYLLQSIVTSIVFLGWGFGLAGRLDYAEQLVLRRRDLGRAAHPQPDLARALSLRSRRVALAIAHVLEAPADAPRYRSARRDRRACTCVKKWPGDFSTNCKSHPAIFVSRYTLVHTASS